MPDFPMNFPVNFEDDDVSETTEIDIEGPDSEPEPEKIAVTDLLVNMFLQQLAHKREYDQIYVAKGLNPTPQGEWGNLNNPILQSEMRMTVAFVIEELMEAINLLKNKPWKQTFRETDADAFYGELADAWHFWLELMILAGMTPDLIQKYYFGMAEKNIERRASGY
jgi:hypothetical protein